MSVLVNHDYPLADELRVVNEDNIPIEGVHITIFELGAFQIGDIDTFVGDTTSDISGGWIDPIEVDDGETYVVLFQKYNEYGPTHVEITT